ncbi:peptidylprolyl isomerase [Mesoterricola sediminis]|uniref:Peptidylprolyl isomerase n=1 Tax=Mesoterricola sediminis TaxID=2927980 RepID=A0AA48KAX5_9BACT|nr:peptidylprolyl isomerase [Mesoterricola sediminis]BDU75171.1 peptidylprolyl isomerase [Mesoterricola sediminis]
MNIRGLSVLCVPCILAGAPEVREEILVVVNGHAITRRVFQQAVEQETAALYRQFSGKALDEKLRDAREKTLQGMIDNFIIQDKAADLGIQVRDEDIRNYIEDIKKQNNFATDEDFERALKGSLGIGLPAYIARSKSDMQKQEVLRREVYSKIAIEDQELRAWYLDHKEDYRIQPRFRIRELVLPKGATPEETEASRAKLAKVKEALDKGTTFENLVKEYSVSTSRSTGGDLGWLPRGVLHANIETASLALKPGEVSGPLETDKNFYMVQLIEAQLDAVKPFEDVRMQIREKLQEPKAQNAIENYLGGMRTRANVRFMVPKEDIIKG